MGFLGGAVFKTIRTNIYIHLLFVGLFLSLNNEFVMADVDYGLDSTKPKCEKLFSASGLQYSNFMNSELEDFHPAFSSTAQAIYFNYSTPGFELQIEHGPRNGSHTKNIEIKKISIHYEPNKISGSTFFKSLFGSEPILISSLEQISYSTSQLLSSKEGGEFLEIYIQGNKGYNYLLMISRATGKVIGYRLYDDYGILNHLRNIYLELKSNRNANQFGRGTWSVAE